MAKNKSENPMISAEEKAAERLRKMSDGDFRKAFASAQSVVNSAREEAAKAETALSVFKDEWLRRAKEEAALLGVEFGGGAARKSGGGGGGGGSRGPRVGPTVPNLILEALKGGGSKSVEEIGKFVAAAKGKEVSGLSVAISKLKTEGKIENPARGVYKLA